MKNDNDRNNSPETSQLIEDYNKNAEDCYNRRKFDKARSWNLKVIELQGENNPNSAWNYLGIAMTYQVQGKIQEAIDNYTRSIELNRDVPHKSVGAYKNRASCYKQVDNFKLAEADYLQLIRLDEQFFQEEKSPKTLSQLLEAYHAIGNFYRDHNLFESALENYNKIIESCANVSPNLLTFEILQKRISAHVQVGKICQDWKKDRKTFDVALDNYNHAINLLEAIIPPENDFEQKTFKEKVASVYVTRGKLHREVGEHDQAKTDFGKAIQWSGDNPKRAGAYIELGKVFHELGQYEDSQKSYKEAIKIEEEANQKQPISAYVSLAGLYREYGYFDRALDAYNKAIELSGPNHSDAGGAYHGRAFLQRELGELKEAWKDYEKAIEVNANGASLGALGPFTHLGNFYRGLEKFEIPSDSKSVKLERLELFDCAIDNYNKAIKLTGEDRPKSAAAYVNLGNLYRERAEYNKRENKLLAVEKDLTSARQNFETAIRLNPFTPRGAGAYASLGLLILDQAEIIDNKVFKEVLDYFDKALTLNPREASIHLYRGELYCKVGKFDRAYEEFEDAIKTAKPKGKKALQWVVLEICLKLIEQERFEKAKEYLEVAFPDVAILKRPFLSEDTLDSQRKREWFNYIELAEENHKRKKHEGEVKDLLIQQFSHTLGSSLQVQRELIEDSIKKRNYDRLSRVLNELNSINRNLGLLSLSARDANQLRAKIKDSLSNQGVSLKDILFKSLVSAFEVVIIDTEYHSSVFERYLHDVSSKHYLREFNGLSESEKDHLLQSWKDDISGGKKEEDKQKIKATTWEILQERKKQTVDPEGPAAERLQGAGWLWILDTWLKDKLSNQFEKLVQRQNLEDLLKWIEAEFFKMDLDIPSRLCFKIDSTGAIFFSWIFKELALNTIKYARAGGKVSISMEGENPLKVKWTNQPVPVQEKDIPGSGAGLKALTILVEKVKGKLTKNGNDHFYEVKFFIPFN